jgi:hypothetical protein
MLHCGNCQAYGPLLGLLLSSSVVLLAPRAVGRYGIAELTVLKIVSALKLFNNYFVADNFTP